MIVWGKNNERNSSALICNDKKTLHTTTKTFNYKISRNQPKLKPLRNYRATVTSHYQQQLHFCQFFSWNYFSKHHNFTCSTSHLSENQNTYCWLRYTILSLCIVCAQSTPFVKKAHVSRLATSAGWETIPHVHFALIGIVPLRERRSTKTSKLNSHIYYRMWNMWCFPANKFRTCRFGTVL